ncbi:chemotaxis protein CheW [Bradyrhizobium glycinis]|uniref:chemotaxis protein CheW n=1 Tax=Bradyrhizobium glycinis TaxID=2751812 RepID=UPI0018D897A5|nr:chemotaxis protein CheW [Bradyrhizobium glycinis]MBH5370567.1 chemotaxis protein CheW [Bradyrhizobium glycinis]
MASKRQQAPETAEAPAAQRRLVAGTDALTQDLLIFRLSHELFGFRLPFVAEIIRPPALAHMPLVPPSLLGLANLRGIVLPVLSLRVLLNMPPAPASDSTRVIVTHGDAPVGFVVDGIDRLLTIPADQLERDEAAAGNIDRALLDGIVRGEEGKSPIKLLGPSRILAGKFVALGMPSATAASSMSPAIDRAVAVPTRAVMSLLSFCLGDQEYALPLDSVREIIPLPDHVSGLPRPEAAVLGVVTLRGRLLPLVSLRMLLGMVADEEGRRTSKVVVVSIGERAVGLLVDATREILRLDPEVVEPAPSLLTRGEGDAEISSICRLDEGRRLVALLSPDRLFRSDVIRRILDEQETGASALQAEETLLADEQFIIFRLGNQEYGVPIGSVSEVARPPEQVTRLPKSPAFIEGVMNLRGNVVPIIDLRRRFELSGAEQSRLRRILVLSINGVRAGFLIDAISEIMKAPANAICPAPGVSPEQMRLISRVINLEVTRRLILLIDPGQLLDQMESDILAKFQGSSTAPAVPVS